MTSVIEIKNICKAFHDHLVFDHLSLSIKRGEFLTLLGPSGCGKTTLLRLLSGFEDVDSGEIFLNQQAISRLSPQQRPVNTVFQSYALFPHMTVFDNVAFGLRCSGANQNRIKERVGKALDRVKLRHLARRQPNQLSGGQQQRVAIARAIVNEPLVLLLDEPLSALDRSLREAMQLELKNLQRELNITFIFVTHDQEEALSMSDRIAVMNEGQIVQLGTPRAIYEKPDNLTVAKFIGQTNIFQSQVTACQDDTLTVSVAGVNYQLENDKNFKTGDLINIVLRPEDLRVWDRSEINSTEGKMHASVEQVIYKGSTVDLRLRMDSGQIISATEFFDEDDEDLDYKIGESVWCEWLPGWEVILPNEN